MARTFKAKKGTLKKRVAGLGQELNVSLGEFAEAADALIEALGLTVEKAQESWETLAIDTFNRIVVRTPVDTGRARAGWEIEKEVLADGTIQFQITNGVHYIVFLEFGSSKQAPQGMVRKTLAEQVRAIRKALKGLTGGG